MRFELQEKALGKNIRDKTIMIIGIGGLGSVVAEMLHREGIGIRLVDKGRVEIQELSRQTLFIEEDETKFKAKQIKKYLEDIYFKGKVKTFHEELVKENLFLLDSADVVIDCSNDQETNTLVGNYVKKKSPLITCRYSGTGGEIFISDKKKLFKDAKFKTKPIEEVGIVNATVHFAAGLIVANSIRTLLGEKDLDNFLTFDVMKNMIRKSSI
jgi:molybdopterin/thiamine biosynthesis adenylyltransferase